jgi:tetratricopeptide (TPR) repeat protein
MRRRILVPAAVLAATLALLTTGCREWRPDQPSPQALEGKKALEDGKAQKAYELLLAASLENPENGADAMLLGRAARAAGHHDVAVTAFEHVLIAERHSPEALLELGITAEAMEIPMLARSYYEGALLQGRGEIWSRARERLAALPEE